MTVRRLRESIHRKQPEKWRDGDWILEHDNAPAHTSHIVQQILAKHGTAQLQQPPYSPDTLRTSVLGNWSVALTKR